MDTSAHNILERIVVDKVDDGTEGRSPRILVTKLSMVPPDFPPWLNGIPDQQGWAVSRLMASTEQQDLTARFKLDPKANSVDRAVIELLHERYSDLPRNTHSQVVFSFSIPVATENGFLLYGIADRGFLWAHGFLCRFQGCFDSPTEIEYLNIWRS
jgi:hypothetical protein